MSFLVFQSSFSIILTRQRELVALLYLSSCCLLTVSALWHSLTVPRIGQQCVIVVYPDHINLRLRENWHMHARNCSASDYAIYKTMQNIDWRCLATKECEIT